MNYFTKHNGNLLMIAMVDEKGRYRLKYERNSKPLKLRWDLDFSSTSSSSGWNRFEHLSGLVRHLKAAKQSEPIDCFFSNNEHSGDDLIEGLLRISL